MRLRSGRSTETGIILAINLSNKATASYSKGERINAVNLEYGGMQRPVSTTCTYLKPDKLIMAHRLADKYDEGEVKQEHVLKYPALGLAREIHGEGMMEQRIKVVDTVGRLDLAMKITGEGYEPSVHKIIRDILEYTIRAAMARISMAHGYSGDKSFLRTIVVSHPAYLNHEEVQKLTHDVEQVVSTSLALPPTQILCCPEPSAAVASIPLDRLKPDTPYLLCYTDGATVEVAIYRLEEGVVACRRAYCGTALIVDNFEGLLRAAVEGCDVAENFIHTAVQTFDDRTDYIDEIYPELLLHVNKPLRKSGEQFQIDYQGISSNQLTPYLRVSSETVRGLVQPSIKLFEKLILGQLKEYGAPVEHAVVAGRYVKILPQQLKRMERIEAGDNAVSRGSIIDLKKGAGRPSN